MALLALFQVSHNAYAFPTKTWKGPECGIKAYEQKQNSSCGEGKREQVLTGREEVKELSLSCPGAVQEGFTTIRKIGYAIMDAGTNRAKLNKLCPSSYPIFVSHERKSWQQGYDTSNVRCKRESKATLCFRGKYKNIYETRTVYPKCDDKTKPIWNSCKLKKTASELESYRLDIELEMEEKVDEVIIRQSAYLEKAESTPLVACTIVRMTDSGDPFLVSAISELETLYFELTDDIFDYSQWAGYDCAAKDLTPSFGTMSCNDFDDKRELYNLIKKSSGAERQFYTTCYAGLSLNQSLAWFVDTESEIEELIKDIKKREKIWSSAASHLKKLNTLKADLKETSETITN